MTPVLSSRLGTHVSCSVTREAKGESFMVKQTFSLSDIFSGCFGVINAQIFA